CRSFLSVLQRDGMQFCHRGTVVPEVIDRCSDRREGKVLKRCGDHAVQKVDGANANGDVRSIMIPTVLGNELCDVRQELRYDIRILGSGDKCGGSPCRRRERRDRINQFLLQPKQVGCGLNQYVTNANGLVTKPRATYIGVLERRELPT